MDKSTNSGFAKGVKGMGNKLQDLDNKAGFITDGYIDKKGTPHGEAARFNMMPPGMDITNQDVSDQPNMPLKTVTDVSYPGDGWGSNRDVSE